jgi:hypothetical protein
MVLAASAPRPSLRRSATEATFLSQLIAARQHLAPQRARRRAPITQAVDAYRIGGRVSVVRMPAGYRKTVVV